MSATITMKKQGTKTLAELVRVLTRKRFITVAEIAKKTKFSPVSIYKRLDDLLDLGCKIESESVKRVDGRKGPTPVGFRLVENSASKKILTSAAS